MIFNTLYEIVKHSVEKFSERIAFSMIDGEDVSYKEVGERVEKVQEMLISAGLNAGDKQHAQLGRELLRCDNCWHGSRAHSPRLHRRRTRPYHRTLRGKGNTCIRQAIHETVETYTRQNEHRDTNKGPKRNHAERKGSRLNVHTKARGPRRDNIHVGNNIKAKGCDAYTLQHLGTDNHHTSVVRLQRE